MSYITPYRGYGRVESMRQYAAAVKNLKHARAAKKKYHAMAKHIGMGLLRRHKMRRHKGGFAPAVPLILGTASAAHNALQKYKPISFLKQYGPSLPKGPIFSAIKSAGDFLQKHLGYGRKRRHRRMRHRGLRVMI